MTVENEYKKMIDLAHKSNTQIAFVHIPTQGPLDERQSYPGNRLSEWSRRQGVAFIDTLPALGAASKSAKLYYEKDGHCRPFGYEIIAKTIFKVIVETGMVP